MAKTATKKKAATKKKVATKTNRLFPGRKGYRGSRVGWFAMVHHDDLFEWSGDIMRRVDFIKSDKPEHEVQTRLNNLLYLGIKERDRAPTKETVLALLKKHNPKHAWSVENHAMIFPSP